MPFHSYMRNIAWKKNHTLICEVRNYSLLAPPVSTIVSYPHRCSSAGWNGSQDGSDRCARSGCSHILHDHKCFCSACIHLSVLQGGNKERHHIYIHAYIWIHRCRKLKMSMPCLHFSVTGFVCILADTEMRQTFSKLKPVTKLNRKPPTEAAMKEKLHSRKTLKKVTHLHRRQTRWKQQKHKSWALWVLWIPAIIQHIFFLFHFMEMECDSYLLTCS